MHTRLQHRLWNITGIMCGYAGSSLSTSGPGHDLIVVSRPDGFRNEFYGVVLCFSSCVWNGARDHPWAETADRRDRHGGMGPRGHLDRVRERGARAEWTPRGEVRVFASQFMGPARA